MAAPADSAAARAEAMDREMAAVAVFHRPATQVAPAPMPRVVADQAREAMPALDDTAVLIPRIEAAIPRPATPHRPAAASAAAVHRAEVPAAAAEAARPAAADAVAMPRPAARHTVWVAVAARVWSRVVDCAARAGAA
ncbi:hypothetical protein, partial [Streptomyces thermolineatus]|uniref:hypothetical protein n=1 Tax=Streptomyces thermolineatus TaxID=44033 RepID=UPI0031E2EA34